MIMSLNNKKLENCICLSSSVKVYVPSTFEVNKTIDNSEYVDKTLCFLSECFGGATAFEALGCWSSIQNGLVKENIKICVSYCDTESLNKYINSVVTHCENIKNEMKQESVSLEVNNVLYFI